MFRAKLDKSTGIGVVMFMTSLRHQCFNSLLGHDLSRFNDLYQTLVEGRLFF